MGNDWQDPRYKDRRLYSDARQPQAPQSSQSWDNSFRQDWRSQATGGSPSSRGPENRQPPGSRQTGNLAPRNGSGMLSRARNGGASGPLGPQPERTSGPLGPEPERSARQQPGASGPLRPSSRGFTPPGNGAVPRRSGAQRDYDAPEPDMPPQRSSGRQTPGRQSGSFSEPPMAGERAGRRISGPTERPHNGSGLLSFARAASSTMRAIITGKHRAPRTSRVEPAMMDGPPPFLPEGEEERPQPRPYRRSRVRLVIHKRLERRSRSSKRLLIASIVTGFMVVVLVGLSIFGASSVSAFYQDTQDKLGALSNPNGFSLTTRFYDRNGNLLWEMLDTKNNNNADYRTYVPYGLIPRDVINATVDTEDKTFWTNSGVDVNSIIRAAIANVTNQEITQGGSTITQQLIKNAFFVDPNTGVAAENYQRKIQEALMAYAVTQQYSKQDILEFYLNIIFYGNLSRGIEAAAENYFDLMPGIDSTTHQFKMGVQKLDLAQAALLAGLPQGPSLYNVCGGTDGQQDRRDAALKRMHDVVLTSMLNIGDITSQQFQDADAEAHTKDFFKCRDEGTKIAPHFVDYVKDQLEQMLAPNDPKGLGEYLLAHAGWNVYTTVDMRLENQVEKIVKHYLFEPHLNHYTFEYPPAGQTAPPLSYPQSKGGHNINDSAVVVMDPNTGDILAMDGSGDYYKGGNLKLGGEYNAATSSDPGIQPGSSFKPIVYATAFEEGWFPALVMQDEYVCFPVQVDPNTQYSKAAKACGKWYAPTNYGFTFATGKSTGETAPPPKPGIRVREALGNSLNIPAVQALYFAGEDNVIIQAERMGIHSNTFHLQGIGPSIALGSAGISLLDMTDAYSVFANGGYHVAPRSILLITDTQGNVIPGGDFHTVTRTQVLSPQTAFLITSILADNNARIAEFGDNNALTFHNNPYVAAKTGTTDDFKDNVTMGYTPYLAVGVWSGNANGATMSPNTIGITGAAPIWHDVIQYATKLFHYPNSYWPKPGGVGRYVINGETGLAPYQGTTGNYADWFNDAMLPDLS
jgi:membrane peptidoglycan carboxypeptidase